MGMKLSEKIKSDKMSEMKVIYASGEVNFDFIDGKRDDRSEQEDKNESQSAWQEKEENDYEVMDY